LEQGTAPWQKPWQAGVLELPFNPVSGKPYRGGNVVQLMVVASSKGYDDPRWLTYRQAQENGWQVRRGEKGTQVEFWQFPNSGSKLDGDSRDETAKSQRDSFIYRAYTVFNAKQLDGIPAHTPKVRQEWEVLKSAEAILRNSGARIIHDQSDRAFYNRSTDTIHLPPTGAFKTAIDYYATALHELVHHSGHPDRLNRETLNESYRFGDLNYAREELRAELASVFLMAERGIPHNPERHAAYLNSWVDALRSDKHEIFRAARDAHKAADLLLQLELHQSLDKALAEVNRPSRAKDLPSEPELKNTAAR
ncbi:MAG: ssDNA-binding domain-containing protein, partial [Acidobacteria bacterium]|nr:ssDNA-binding domain-containing protein [Acidobacteriota bacterium]